MPIVQGPGATKSSGILSFKGMGSKGMGKCFTGMISISGNTLQREEKGNQAGKVKTLFNKTQLVHGPRGQHPAAAQQPLTFHGSKQPGETHLRFFHFRCMLLQKAVLLTF